MIKLIVAIIAILLIAGCTTYQGTFVNVDAAQPLGELIIISDYQFNPHTITVDQGELITWENRDKDAHTLHYNGIETKEIARGGTFSILAETPGTFSYSSGNHPFMEGTVIVR